MMPPNSPPEWKKAVATFEFNGLQLMRKERSMSINDKKYLITEPVKEMRLQLLFRQFLQEKQFLQNISPNTQDLYARAFATFGFESIPEQSEVNQTIVALREQGMTPTTLNAYGRCVNVFFNWLVANHHTDEPVKVKRLKGAVDENVNRRSNTSAVDPQTKDERRSSSSFVTRFAFRYSTAHLGSFRFAEKRHRPRQPAY